MSDTDNNLVAISICFGKEGNQKAVGAAVRRKIGSRWNIDLFQFLDNDQCSHLDSFLLSVGGSPSVHPLYLPEEYFQGLSKNEYRKVTSILNNHNFDIQYVKKSFFRKAEVKGQLLKLVGQVTHNTTVAEVCFFFKIIIIIFIYFLIFFINSTIVPLHISALIVWCRNYLCLMKKSPLVVIRFHLVHLIALCG
jgi:hypothetical protein